MKENISAHDHSDIILFIIPIIFILGLIMHIIISLSNIRYIFSVSSALSLIVIIYALFFYDI